VGDTAWRAIGFARTEAKESWQVKPSSRATAAGFDAASILEHAQVSVIVTDLAGTIVDCNRQAEILYGRTRDELVGSDAAQYTIDELPAELITEIADRLITGATWEGEFRVRRSDGSIVVVRAIDSPILGDSGELRGIVSVSLDITERKQAERHLEEALARLDVLARVGELLAVELDIEDRLQSVARVLLSEFADLCALWLLAPDGGLRLVTIAHHDPRTDAALGSHALRSMPAPAGSGIEQALHTRAAVILHGAEATNLCRQILSDTMAEAALDCGSIVCIPVSGRGDPQGVLCFGRDTAADRYTSDDVVAGEELARRIAVAIENAQRFEQQRNAAEILQRSLLPERLPEVGFAQLAARYVPGSSEITIGGDWYDAMVPEDDRLVMAIGDVAGHGLRAAVVMGRARHSLEFCMSEGLSPGVMLQRMNRFLYGAREPDLVTAAVASFDARTRMLTVASAGHPPILLVEPSGATTYVQVVNGPPLAAMEEPRYEEVRVEVAPGSLVLLYTDGIIERRGEQLASGFARLSRSVQEGPAGPGELADHLLRNLLPVDGPDDDAAILAARLS
jgi:PAS domain S-box-containing protein